MSSGYQRGFIHSFSKHIINKKVEGYRKRLKPGKSLKTGNLNLTSVFFSFHRLAHLWAIEDVGQHRASRRRPYWKGQEFDHSICLQSQQHGLGQQDHCLVQWLSEGGWWEVREVGPGHSFKGAFTRLSFQSFRILSVEIRSGGAASPAPWPPVSLCPK